MISNVEGERLPLASASKLSSATPSAGDTPTTPPETGKQLLDRTIEERKNKLSHGLDFANAKSGKRKSKKETAVAGSNLCDISEIALESCSMRLNPVGSVSRVSLVLFGRLHICLTIATQVKGLGGYFFTLYLSRINDVTA